MQASSNNHLSHTAAFYVADWLVDPATDRIQRDQVTIKLEPRVMALLVHMAQRPNELVTREALERDVWSGTVVGYDALTSSMIKLRKALGDDSRQPRFIETVSKKGYRLIAPIRPMSIKEAPAAPTAQPAAAYPKHKRLYLFGVAVLLLAAVILTMLFFPSSADLPRVPSKEDGHPAVAVLPFDDLSGDPAQSYFRDGISADIATALSNFSGLFVIAGSSTSSFKDQQGDVRKIADALGVRYLLTGSVRRNANRLRVNTQLIDAKSGVQLWSERYDHEIRDVLEVQEDIADKIAATLSVRVTEEEKRRKARRYTFNSDAYDEFLRGQALYVRSNNEDNLQARALFQSATERDPNFARAYSGLALTYIDESRFQWGKNSAGMAERALEFARKAIAIDERLPQAFGVLAYVHMHRGEYPLAAAAARRAIELNPNDADYFVTYALTLAYQGEAKTSVRMIRKAIQQNPGYPARYASALGQTLYILDQHDEAIAAFRDAIERNASLLTSYIFLTSSLNKLGKKTEASWSAEQLRVMAPGFDVEHIHKMILRLDPAKMEDMKNNLRAAGL